MCPRYGPYHDEYRGKYRKLCHRSYHRLYCAPKNGADAIGLDAEAAWVAIRLNSFPWNEFSESSIQRASQQHLQTVNTK